MSDSLRAAMAAVMHEVSYVQKKTRVQGYTAAGESDVIAAIRPAMLRHGIVGPVPVDGEVVEVKHITKDNGKQMRFVVLRRVWRFSHVPTGETLDVVTYGEGADSLDKATLKAMTASKKYAIREAFCLETGDDPDKVASEDESASEATYARAYTAIREAADAGALDRLVKAVDSRELLTHVQREKLRKLADSRRAELRNPN